MIGVLYFCVCFVLCVFVIPPHTPHPTTHTYLPTGYGPTALNHYLFLFVVIDVRDCTLCECVHVCESVCVIDVCRLTGSSIYTQDRLLVVRVRVIVRVRDRLIVRACTC